MTAPDSIPASERYRALGLSTFAFTVCFAVWTLFSVIGVSIKQQLGLSDTEFGLLVATPILTGSVSRLFLGVIVDRHGGRLVFTLQMLVTSVAVWMLTRADSYVLFLIAALFLGLAGGSFIIGVAYVSRWFEDRHQGKALGLFGVGNVGAAVTNFAAPFLVLSLGWEGTAQVYATVLAATAVLFYLLARTDPVQARRSAGPTAAFDLAAQLAPLRDIRVWRFSAYYFFSFGAFVALASFLPRYYVGAYGLELTLAGALAGLYSLPGSVFRAFGGWMSDRMGPRLVNGLALFGSLPILVLLSWPEIRFSLAGIRETIEFRFAVPLWLFVGFTVVLGFLMSLGKAAVFKYIPTYYPDHVGPVGGLVGMIGGLGGFVLPIAFGALLDITGVWSSPFLLLFLVVALTALWKQLAIRRIETRSDRAPARDNAQAGSSATLT